MTKESKQNAAQQLSDEELLAEFRKRKKSLEAKEKKERKQYEKDKDYFVEKAIHEFEKYHKALKDLKDFSIVMGTDLYQRMFELKGREPREVKEFSIVNAANDKKIVVQEQDRVAFTEDSKVAIEAIKEYFENKFAPRSKQAYDIIDQLLMRSNKGEYDPKQLARLRKQVLEINDTKLTEAFEMLENTQTVVGSAMYVRAYKKNDKGKWEDIVLQFSAL